MSGHRTKLTFAGRSVGTVLLVFIQFLIGAIHAFFGVWLLCVSIMGFPYSVYTTAFGLLMLLFTLGLWMRKCWGYLGTVSTLLFVTLVDTLTLLDLPSIQGVPKFAAVAEIAYSLMVLFYLAYSRVRAETP